MIINFNFYILYTEEEKRKQKYLSSGQEDEKTNRDDSLSPWQFVKLTLEPIYILRINILNIMA